MRTHTESVWVDVGVPSKNVWGVPSLCPLPRFSPNFDGPISSSLDDPDCYSSSLPSSPVVVPRPTMHGLLLEDSVTNSQNKTELHRVLNCIQCSNDYGIYLSEDMRDPRRNYIDDYWREIADSALGIDDLHRLIGHSSSPLSDEARTRMHQLARLFERLSKRIDRVVLAS